MFHVQLGDPKRTQDALRVASSFLADGLEKFAAGELNDALALFEQALAVNEKYLESTASGNILCCSHIAAVHDELGNLGAAFAYYERARISLSSPRIPGNEANFLARRKRHAMLKHVQQKLEKIPRTHEPKVGVGVHHSDVASLISSMWEAGEVYLRADRLKEALVSFEQVLALSKQFEGAGVDGLMDIASTLARLGLVHSQLGDIPRAEVHLRAVEALLKELPGELGSEAATTHKETLQQLRAANLAVERALSSQHTMAHRPRSKLRTCENHDAVAPVVSIESLTHECRPSLPPHPSSDATSTEAAVTALCEVHPNQGPEFHQTASSSRSAGIALPATYTEAKGESRAGTASPAGTNKRVGTTDPADVSESTRVIAAPTQASTAASENEDEFAWRKGQEPDGVEGKIDDRVEGAIEQINVCRDAMNQAQIGLDGTTSKLVAQERHLQHELAKLEAEYGPFLQRLADYEEQKVLTSSSAARVVEAERSSGATAQERAERRNRAASNQTESLKMAMELQAVFDKLVPYFVCRTLLEQQLEDGRQAVAASKKQVQSARRAYNYAMDQLETLSLDIQRKQAGPTEAAAETGHAV